MFDRMLGNRSFKCIATWVLLAVAGLAWAGTAAAGTVTGTVKDALTNAALQGVTVTVTQQTTKKATTNASGVYSIASVTAGTVTLKATKTGYSDFTTGNVVVPASGTVTAPLILLQPKGIITGTVVSSVGGAAVSGATVKITGTTTSVSTATNGTFTLYAVTGSYTLTITKTNWVSLTTASFAVTNGQTTALGTIPFVQKGTLSGTVVNANGGAVVASARVTVTGTSTYANTSTSGVYTLSTGAGPVTLTVTKTGWLTATTGSITVVGGVTTTVPAIQLTQLATVTGTVKDAGTNANLQGVTVTLQSDPSKTATTSSSGVFSISSVPGGSQSFNLVKTGYQSRSAGPFTISGTSTNVGTILLTSAAGTITGTIQDSGAGNAGLSGATVTVNGVTPTISGTSDANGAFSLANVPAGSRSVHVTLAGYVAADSSAVTVELGQSVSVGNLTLARIGVAITGVVRSTADSSPIAGVTLTVDEQPARTTTTGGDGTYTLSDVGWGFIHLTVSHPSYTSQSREIDLGTDGSNQEFDLEVGRGTITGRVGIGPSSEGAPSIWVHLEDDPGFGTNTDWQGIFVVENVPAGLHRLVLARSDTNSFTTGDFEVHTGETTTLPLETLTQRPVRLYGWVQNPDIGQMLEGVTVMTAREGRWMVTDASGYFEFVDVPPGVEVLTFSKDGYPPVASDYLTLWPGQEMQSGGDLRPHNGLTPSGVLRGVIRDSLGQPVSGATITARGRGATTSGSDGVYQLEVPRGDYALSVDAPGFRSQVVTGVGGGHVYEAAWQARRDVVLATAAETSTVEITTTDPVTGEPRQGGFWLATASAFYWLDTAPNGHRTLTDVEPGTMLGWVRPRFAPPAGTLHLDWSGPATMPTSPSWAAGGFVLRAGTLEPVESADVLFINSGASFSQTVTTDAAGRFRLAAAPLGDYLVTVGTPSGLHESESWSFTAEDNGTLLLREFELVADADAGLISILSPVSGGVVGVPHVTVSGTADFALAGDYVRSVLAGLDPGWGGPRQVTFDPDGRHFSVEFNTDTQSGPATLWVEVQPTRGAPHRVTQPVVAERQATITGLTMTPDSVLAGQTALGTVTASPAAPASGTIVHLSTSNPAVATVPPSVMLTQGQTSVSFVVTAGATTVPSGVDITARAGGISTTAGLFVDSFRVVGLQLAPDVVLGGLTVTGAVTLNAPAPAGGVTVALSSTVPGLAAVPSTVIVPSGSLTESFAVATSLTASVVIVEITASAGGSTSTGALTVGPLAVSSITITPSTITAGSSSTVTVSLNGPAPSGGSAVALSSSAPQIAPVPGSVIVPEGSAATSFQIATSFGQPAGTAEIFATAGGETRSAVLTVDFIRPVQLSLSASTVIGGSPATGTVTINAAAPPGGFVVTLTSSDPAIVSVPTSLTVPEGATIVSFTATTSLVQSTGTAEIAAAAGGATQSATLTVEPIGPVQVRFSDNPVPGGHPSTGTVTLNAPAPAAGLVVTLTSANPALVSVPASLTVPAGASTATFLATTSPVTASAGSLVTAASPGKSASLSLDLFPITLSGFGLYETRTAAGFTFPVYLTLTFPAPAGGLVVQLTSSNPSLATIDPTVTVAEGVRETSFPFTTVAGVEGPVTLTASLNGSSRSVVVTTVIPRVASLTFNPATIGGGAEANATLQMNVGIPSPGLTVALTTDRPDLITVPATTTNDSWQHWPTLWVDSPTTLHVTASLNGGSATAPLTLERARLEALSVGPSSMPGIYTSLGNSLRLYGAAPAGGARVVLTSSSSNVSPDATVIIPAGQQEADFEIAANVTTCQPESVVISATYDGVTLTQPFTLIPSVVDEVRAITHSVIAGQQATLQVAFYGHPDNNCTYTVTLDDPTRGVVSHGFDQCARGDAGLHPHYYCRAYVPTYVTDLSGPLTVTYTMNGTSAHATFDIEAPEITGIAPGVLVPGQAGVAVYGPSFELGTTVELQGPYDLVGETNPHLVCKVGSECPTTSLPGTVNVTGDAVVFGVPEGTLDGHYYLRTRNPAGEASNVTKYLTVRPLASTRPTVPATGHNMALPLQSGETYTGTFVADGDPEHTLQDYNMYYFLGTAGSRITVTLERVDTTKTWEHPDSLDPELQIMAPDDFVYQNLVSYDRQPGLDLNAQLTNAVLPQTGFYFIRAGTSKGAGEYRLHFEVTQQAPPAAGERVVPMLDTAITAPVGQALTPIAVSLDPRGYRLAGALVHYTRTPAADDTGTMVFTGGAVVTSDTYGGAETEVTPTGEGRMAFAASLLRTFATDLTPAGGGGAGSDGSSSTASASSARALTVSTASSPIPRYQPVGFQRVGISEVYADQMLGLSLGPAQKVAVQRRPARGAQDDEGTGDWGRGTRQIMQKDAAGLRGGTSATRRTTHDTLDDPLDATTAVPMHLVQPDSAGGANSGEQCTPEAFVLGVVPEGTELHPPFSAVLTDLTPPTGGGDPHGEVGLDGIWGHRIEKTLQLRLDMTDATGQPPDYPVLVQLNLGGLAHGKLLRNGGQLECDTVNFLWKAHDAEGVPIVNQVDYRLGKLSRYVGVLPDPSSPGGVKPAWGVAEILDLAAQAKLPDDEPSDPFFLTTNVHPEPGRPDRLQCLMPGNQPCGDTFRIWPGYNIGKLFTDAYFAADLYGNTVFGLTDTAETQPGNGVTVDFLAQLVEEDLGGDFAAYTLDLEWGPDASLLTGSVPVTLSVSVPASLPDWPAATITKTVTLDLQGGPDHLLIPKQHYDGRFDSDDGEMPMTVSPGAETAGMQSQALGDTPRLVLLAVAGTHVPYSIPFGGDEPSLEPQKVYRQQVGGWHKVEVPPTSQDLTLETAPGGAVRLSLVDAYLQVVPQTAFRAHRCPRQEHLTEETPAPPACTLGPVDSDGMTGILPSLALNEPGGERGYLGIELTKAPVVPGTYYIWVESIGTTPYRVRIASNLVTRDSQEAEYRGGYAICTVHGVKLLNEDLAPITKTLNMSLNRAVYLQEIDPDKDGDSYQSDVVLHNEDTQEDFTLSNVTFWRVGKTPSFLTGLITVVSPDPPLAPPAAAWNEGITMQLDARVQNTSPAGTLAPSRGRYTLLNQKTGDVLKSLRVQTAATRLVEITNATPNFDAVTEGEDFGDRRKIQADVKWNADGWVDLRLTNVDNAAVFTFDYWEGLPLTTDLRAGGGKQVCSPKISTREMVLRLPESNDPPFQAVVGMDGDTKVTVKPGLYRLVARYSDTPPGLSPTQPVLYCDTDLPGQPLCLNEWIVSVGQRVFLGVEPTALANLGQDLEAVTPAGGMAESALAFLSRVAIEVTTRYQAASGNVVARADSSSEGFPRPFLTHQLLDELPPTGGLEPVPNYGHTRTDVQFPLLDPALNLVGASGDGISRKLLFSAPSWGQSGQWEDHPPKLVGRNDPFCHQPANPCPADVFFNRYAALVTHETAHGLGIMSAKQYFAHGAPSVAATLNARAAGGGMAGGYVENEPSPTEDTHHEPILPPPVGLGFGQTSAQANEWLMTYAPLRWNNQQAFSPGEYDLNPDPGNPSWEPVRWLIFDRPLRFSLASDYLGASPARPDQSIQRFFSERIPLCQLGRRDCR